MATLPAARPKPAPARLIWLDPLVLALIALLVLIHELSSMPDKGAVKPHSRPAADESSACSPLPESLAASIAVPEFTAKHRACRALRNISTRADPSDSQSPAPLKCALSTASRDRVACGGLPLCAATSRCLAGNPAVLVRVNSSVAPDLASFAEEVLLPSFGALRAAKLLGASLRFAGVNGVRFATFYRLLTCASQHVLPDAEAPSGGMNMTLAFRPEHTDPLTSDGSRPALAATARTSVGTNLAVPSTHALAELRPWSNFLSSRGFSAVHARCNPCRLLLLGIASEPLAQAVDSLAKSLRCSVGSIALEKSNGVQQARALGEATLLVGAHGPQLTIASLLLPVGAAVLELTPPSKGPLASRWMAMGLAKGLHWYRLPAVRMHTRGSEREVSALARLQAHNVDQFWSVARDALQQVGGSLEGSTHGCDGQNCAHARQPSATVNR